MLLFASFVLAPATVAAWLAAGLAAAWMAGLMMEEPTYGARGNYILGAIGGLLGGFAFAYWKDDDGVLLSAAVALGVALLFIFAGRIIMAMKSE